MGICFTGYLPIYQLLHAVSLFFLPCEINKDKRKGEDGETLLMSFKLWIFPQNSLEK